MRNLIVIVCIASLISVPCSADHYQDHKNLITTRSALPSSIQATVNKRTLRSASRNPFNENKSSCCGPHPSNMRCLSKDHKSESDAKPSCDLICGSYLECDYQPGVNFSKEVKLNNSKCSNKSSLLIQCDILPPCNNKTSNPTTKLIVNFKKSSHRIFEPLTITLGDNLTFRILPCAHERIRLNIDLNETNFKAWMKPICHEVRDIRFLIECRDQDNGSRFTKEFKGNNYRPGNNYSAGTTYNCTVKFRYEHNELACYTTWSKPIFKSFSTRIERPSAPPVPLSYLRNENKKICQIYFAPVPKDSRNGPILEHRCVCEDKNPKTTMNFSVRVDCPHVPLTCLLNARTSKNWSDKNASLTIQATSLLPELQLWVVSQRGLIEPKVLLPAGVTSDGGTLLICRCVDCNARWPTCSSMRTVKVGDPLPLLKKDLTTHKIAVLPKSSSQLSMSEWVNCIYENSSNVARKKESTIVASWDETFSQDHRNMRVKIDVSELRCPRRTHPIDVIISRLVCPKTKPKDEKHKRIIGTTAMEFFVRIVPDCEIFLLEDGVIFEQIYQPDASKQNAHLWIPFLASLPVMIILIIVFYCFRKPFQRLRSKLNEGSKMEQFEFPLRTEANWRNDNDDTEETDQFSEYDIQGINSRHAYDNDSDDYYIPQ